MKVAAIFTAFEQLTKQHVQIPGTQLWVRAVTGEYANCLDAMDALILWQIRGENFVNTIPADLQASDEYKRQAA